MTNAPTSRREIPDATVARLPVYLRVLRALSGRGVEVVSSEELADAAGVRSSGLRKDLSFLGSYGVRGVGYDVERLSDEITRELGLQGEFAVAIVGMGNLGRALADYSGFSTRGFSVRWLIDTDPQLAGTRLSTLTVVDFDGFRPAADESVIGVIATPPHAAQSACDELVARGVRSILNFAPGQLTVPDTVAVRRVDLATELQILAFHEQRARAELVSADSLTEVTS
ncbi:redox-sensing transcriptional repressor Rex [Yimella sp. cx-573]|nr:redox-sensing transcriptional repressor Rex [Yimella sp. cx-573]